MPDKSGNESAGQVKGSDASEVWQLTRYTASAVFGSSASILLSSRNLIVLSGRVITPWAPVPTIKSSGFGATISAGSTFWR